MSVSEQAPPRGITSDFVRTHCVICAGGQTITWTDGRQASYCLLLREWMTDSEGRALITACDRFEAKDDGGS
jgi:hypothetical protein